MQLASVLAAAFSQSFQASQYSVSEGSALVEPLLLSVLYSFLPLVCHFVAAQIPQLPGALQSCEVGANNSQILYCCGSHGCSFLVTASAALLFASCPLCRLSFASCSPLPLSSRWMSFRTGRCTTRPWRPEDTAGKQIFSTMLFYQLAAVASSAGDRMFTSRLLL